MIEIHEKWETKFSEMSQKDAIIASFEKWERIEGVLYNLLKVIQSETCALCSFYHNECTECIIKDCEAKGSSWDAVLESIRTAKTEVIKMKERIEEMRYKCTTTVNYM
jgi:hypothetical protein